MDDPKLVDLEPHQWVSEREKPKEPIFGPGWPFGLAVLLTIVLATAFIELGWLDRAYAVAAGGILGSVIAGAIAAAR